MPGLTFRDATFADLPTIVSMYADDILGTSREDAVEPLPAHYEQAFRAIEADPRHRLVVAVADEQIVGTLQLSYLPHVIQRGGERAQVEAVRVRSDQRGTGLGGALLEWAIEQARARGCRVVQLTSNAARHDARRFYERLGFVASHVGMKLALDDP